MVGKNFKMKTRFCGEDFQEIKMERLIIVMMLSALSSLLNDLTLSHRHLTVIQPVPWHQAGVYLILFSRKPEAFIPREHKVPHLEKLSCKNVKKNRTAVFWVPIINI